VRKISKKGTIDESDDVESLMNSLDTEAEHNLILEEFIGTPVKYNTKIQLLEVETQ
jgi:hypothetical protein